MASFKTFLKAGHPPTLFASFLYFDFCFAIWVLNGAMAPFISETFNLTPGEKGFMVSVPILAGAIMRFPLGVLAQYIGRKNAALTEMSLIFGSLIFGYLMVPSYSNVLAMGVFLGIAGASFGVALSLGSGWFPPKYKGLAMGIAGAGNSGTVLAMLFAPPLAEAYGWQAVYGIGALFMLLPILVMVIFAKEPPDREKQTLKEHLSCLFQKDGWTFNLIYIITFGGFIGLSSFLPTYYHDNFGVSKVEAGQLTMLAALMGSAVRVVGGWAADRWGGINTLTAIFGIIILTMLAASLQIGIVGTTILFMVCFAALGAGNGALFQLVPLRWPLATAVAGSMIGEIGALGGSFIPNAMGISKGNTGSFAWGFISFAILGAIAFIVLRIAQRKWTKVWVDKGGRAKVKQEEIEFEIHTHVPGLTLAAAEKEVHGPNYAYRTIIYPVGNSQLADKAREQAAYLSKTTGSRLVLLYVDEKFHTTGVLATDSPEWESVRQNWINEGKNMLISEAKKLKELGATNLEVVFGQGDVASEIVALAKEKAAELIILASHVSSPIGKLLMGSRTHNIFKESPCPILRIVR
ncbi:MAG: MFS transporter [Crocinitomicaceae bacterium]|nr:MFS transporter [Crocinitomicaceae bacterium]MBK6953723.1 MFS transporter [Crocinitomicaceae bacterium]MBK9593469.1 MFS transporter [Crocinitomicaceae bacterium]